MLSHFHSLLIVIFYFHFVAGQANAQNQGLDQEWPCGGDKLLLMDSIGEPVWIGFDELKRHSIHMAKPKLPSSARVVGKVIVDILIDTQGNVKCAKSDADHPILKHVTIEAAKKWRFRSFSTDRHPVAVYGRLEFDFDRRHENELGDR